MPLGEGSAPHGVIQGPDGAAWITDGGLNAIVRFDPATDEVTVWPLPGRTGYANLNTAAFDGDGHPSGSPARPASTAGSIRRPARCRSSTRRDGRGPYGITATPVRRRLLRLARRQPLARIDRETGEATVIEPPTADQGARRVWSDSKGNLWISRMEQRPAQPLHDPSTGAWKSWRCPGDRPQAYAVYVDERDIVWVTDFGANATLAFDPATERWTRYPGSGARANVRQILGPPGWIFLPESGLDRIMVVRTEPRLVRGLLGCGAALLLPAPPAARRPAGRKPEGLAKALPPLAMPAMGWSGADTAAGPTLHGLSAGPSPPRPVSTTRRRCAGLPGARGADSGAARPLPCGTRSGGAGNGNGIRGLSDPAERRALISWLGRQ